MRSIIRGLLSYTPIINNLNQKGTGGTNSARYCYSVWLRHIIKLYECGMKEIPKIIAEIGPGDSIGTGLAALLTGTDKYYAFDIIKHSENENNKVILSSLVELFRNKADIPGEDEFPELKPYLSSYKFPSHILPAGTLTNLLSDDRIKKIENALTKYKRAEIEIKYIVPWTEGSLLTEPRMDMIFSQAVMEHVMDIETAYSLMHTWLKQGGYMSHQIDYKAHEIHKVWNGHWRYPEFIWTIIMHGRNYPINRCTHSQHIDEIKKAGFKILNESIISNKGGYKRKRLSSEYKNIPEEDLTISGAFIAALNS